jgi:hypothetical protein
VTLHALQVPPRDVTADALGLVLDAPAPAPLAELTLHDGSRGALTLGVLGASHVVTATAAGHRLTEQVSCDAVAAGGHELPGRTRSGSYRLSSETREVGRRELEATADRLRHHAGSSDAWLCGTFPGDANALTALTASAVDGGWTWESWHLYPGAERSVIVTTRSRWTP